MKKLQLTHNPLAPIYLFLAPIIASGLLFMYILGGVVILRLINGSDYNNYDTVLGLGFQNNNLLYVQLAIYVVLLPTCYIAAVALLIMQKAQKNK